MSNPAFNSNRGFPPNGGRGRGYPPGGYNPQMANHSPQPFRAMPNQPRGGMPQFQPQQHPNSPYRQAQQLNRSPAMTPANPAFANGPGYYQPGFQPVRIFPHNSLSSFPISGPGKPTKPAGSFQSSQHVQQNGKSSTAVLKQPKFRVPDDKSNAFLRSISPSSSSLSPVSSDFELYLTELQHQNAYGMPGQGADPYYGQYYGQPGYGMQQSIHNPYVPASPGRGYPQPMQGPYGMHQPFVPPQGAQNMSRTPCKRQLPVTTPLVLLNIFLHLQQTCLRGLHRPFLNLRPPQ
jgi:translation initiation factor 4G